MGEKAQDNFEKGIFWELYKDLERQFENFLEYVPYLEGNENVYSFRLLNLILSIGGHVDSAFKEMARYPKFSGNDDCNEILKRAKQKQTVPIILPLKAFETEYTLSEKKVIFKRLPERENVTPFKPRSAEAKAPKWWKIYNGIKHDVGVNIKEAKLRTTLNALAGAFLLNVIHTPAILRLNDYGILKCHFAAVIPQKLLEDKLKKKQKVPGFVETPLFIYDFMQ